MWFETTDGADDKKQSSNGLTEAVRNLPVQCFLAVLLVIQELQWGSLDLFAHAQERERAKCG